MNLLLMVFAGVLAAAGLLVAVRGLVGSTVPLDMLAAELHRPRDQVRSAGLRPQLVRWALGQPSAARDADLAICERSADRYVWDRLLWTLIGASPGLACAVLAAVGAPLVRTMFSLGAVPVGALIGWLYSRVDLRSDAAKARRVFRHALSGYLELVTILMAGGAGVETALLDAAAAGQGTPFRHLRSALSAAQARREAPWRTFGELGARLGVTELEELEASMTLAGGGAQVRDSLTAKAAGIRLRDVAQLESEAHTRSETMVLPVALMFAGFLVLIGWPALTALSTP